MEQEFWVSVTGYEGICEVSNLGRYRTLPRRVGIFPSSDRFVFYPGRIYKCRTTNRYHSVLIRKGDVKKYHPVHVLVATEFIANPDNKPMVNHINGHKNDNHALNLEWATCLENNDHARDIGLNKEIGETHHMARLTNEQVIEIFKSSLSISELSLKYKVSKALIRHIKTGKSWSKITGKKWVQHHVKLKKNIIIDIYTSKSSVIELAKKYNVTTTAIAFIKQGRSYANLTSELIKGVSPKIYRPSVNRKTSKLEEEEILNSKETFKILAERYNVSTSTINRIKNWSKWNCLHPPNI
jgi:Mor family transcriptional regulator